MVRLTVKVGTDRFEKISQLVCNHPLAYVLQDDDMGVRIQFLPGSIDTGCVDSLADLLSPTQDLADAIKRAKGDIDGGLDLTVLPGKREGKPMDKEEAKKGLFKILGFDQD